MDILDTILQPFVVIGFGDEIANICERNIIAFLPHSKESNEKTYVIGSNSSISIPDIKLLYVKVSDAVQEFEYRGCTYIGHYDAYFHLWESVDSCSGFFETCIKTYKTHIGYPCNLLTLSKIEWDLITTEKFIKVDEYTFVNEETEDIE